jgi:hypothetical protein
MLPLGSTADLAACHHSSVSKDFSKEVERILDAVKWYFDQVTSKQRISPRSLKGKSVDNGTPVLTLKWDPKIPHAYRKKDPICIYCEIRTKPQTGSEWIFDVLTWVEIKPSLFYGSRKLSGVTAVYDLETIARDKCISDVCELVHSSLLEYREYDGDPGEIRMGSYYNG